MLTASPPFFGRSPAMLALMRLCEKFAPTRLALLLLGPPGVGKTMLAHHMHTLSGLRDRPFISKSAAQIPESLAEPQLLGHGRGAFTGAHQAHRGLFERAHGGTLFLDEIGDAGPAVQRMLLRLVEGTSLCRIGEERELPIAVRFIGATNADVKAMSADGRFRVDLLDRFAPFVLHVPPLAARPDEILPLAERFVAEAAGRLERTSVNALSDDVRGAFLAASWAGNIRQLQRTCEYGTVLAEPGEAIGLNHLPDDFVTALGLASGHSYDRSVRGAKQALADAKGNKTRAAQLFGVTRPYFHDILKRAAASDM